MDTAANYPLAKSDSASLPPWPVHVSFWLGYTAFWHTVFTPDLFSLLSFVTSSIYTLCHAGASYFNIFVLMPRLLNRKHYLPYIAAVVVTLFLSAGLLGLLLYGWFEWVSPGRGSTLLEDRTYLIASLLGSTFTALGLTTVIQLLLQRRRLERRQRQLERDKMTAELQFLRGQLDPHFLFNALNGV